LASKDKANLGQSQGQYTNGEFKDKVSDLDCEAETKAKDLAWISSQGKGLTFQC